MNKKFEINNLVRENIRGLQPYSSARDEYVSDGSEMVFLDANENPFENGVNRYPDPRQRSLKAILATQKGVSSDRILLGNGSDEVLDLIFRAFCEPKRDNVITLPPTYGMYKVLANINHIENREVLLTADFQPNVESILKQVDACTKLIFLCSPNNPTGNSFSIASVERLLKEFPGLVIIDEAYIHFSDRESWLGRLDVYPNLVIAQTLSKAYGMAGIRLGICIASTQIIAVLNRIKPPYNVNELTQERAMERLLNIDYVEAEVADIIEERDRLFEVLLQIIFIEKVYPSDANFILVKVDDADKRYAQILQRGVVVRNRTTQPLCENTLRFTVGTSEENEKLIEVLRGLSK
ncbi:histidinol-phosphate transaminase [Flavobacteriaceae bacterium F89]|uniref:Histidinol-phosphate aminotransferase n=1 Tax=Cerina litoralis TaxID=2874477 RepID=A0AAE3JQ00_9FLAO|nr:histidinol-phosphate transaminase [Cerina litoralis]MCG2461324.1 histidinol-phosphate transaminase [Cerina litoralis]